MENARYLYAISFILLISNLVLAGALFKHLSMADKQTASYADNTKTYSLLNPRISKIGKDNFVLMQEKFIPSYRVLKDNMESYLNKKEGTYAVYFEDLYSGAWIGIREQQAFAPASLLKIPVAAAIFKMSEDKEIDINKNITIEKEDLGEEFGNLVYLGAQNTYSAKELIEIMLRDSDNTALNALSKQIGDRNIIEARLGLGLPISSITNREIDIKVSAKQMSNVLRTLYYSAYLNRENSQILLSALAGSHFDKWLKAGIPSQITIAHKFGIFIPDKNLHDCGIIYHPKRDYILCVMSTDVTNKETEKVMPAISKMVYEYVTEN